jgi:hypothetical protein
MSNRFMVFGISSIGGYHPAKLSLYERFLDAFRRGLSGGNLQVMDMLNVRYLVTGAEMPALRRLRLVWKGTDYRGEPRFVYENLGAFARAWLVGSYRVAADDETLDLLASGAVDLSREAILNEKPHVEPVPAAVPDSARVDVEELGFNTVRVRTKSPSPSILVLSEVYYPDWRVQVDGRPAELLRADYLLRGVALEAGEHEVVFRYDSSLIKESAYASATMLGIVTLTLIAGLLISSRGRRGGSTRRSSHV